MGEAPARDSNYSNNVLILKAMKKAMKREQFHHHTGSGTVTILIALLAAGFIFYNIIQVALLS